VFSRLHSYEGLGQAQTPAQTELRQELGLSRPFWKDIIIAVAAAAAGAITTNLVFGWANKRKRAAKRTKR